MVRTTANSKRTAPEVLAAETTASDNEQVWEDVEEEEEGSGQSLIKLRAESKNRSTATLRGAARKRRVVKSAFKASSPRRVVMPAVRSKTPGLTPSPTGSPDVPPEIVVEAPTEMLQQPIITREELRSAVTQGTRGVIVYAGEVLTHFFKLLKRPLSFFLVLWAISMISGLFVNILRPVLVPLCLIPGISRSSLCAIPKLYNEEGRPIPQHADFPKMMEIQSKTFEQLLDDSIGSSGLALEIKKAEMATADLVTLVRVSRLKSKEILADTLVEFTGDARKTARGLQKLSAKINGAVDK